MKMSDRRAQFCSKSANFINKIDSQIDVECYCIRIETLVKLQCVPCRPEIVRVCMFQTKMFLIWVLTYSTFLHPLDQP